MGKVFRKCGACLLLLLLFSSLAEAQDVIRVVVNGDNVNIRSAPSTKGKVYSQANSGEVFLVDSAMIQDKSDKSMWWHKILFSIDDYEGRVFQAHKMPVYNFSYPYISTRYVRKEPLTYEDIRQLDYLNRGRPVQVKVGDDFSQYMDGATPYVLRRPATLLRDPKPNAEKITLPAGTVIIFHDETEADIYYNMDETAWTTVIGRNEKMLGWITWDDWKKLSMERQ